MATQDLMHVGWNFSKLFEGLDEYADEIPATAKKTGRKVAMDGLGRMIGHAPVATGYLRGSASVFINGRFYQDSFKVLGKYLGIPNRQKTGEPPPDSTEILWGFNAHYAAKVHEDPNAGRKGGGPKYVERVLVARMGPWMQFYADAIKALRAGKKG